MSRAGMSRAGMSRAGMSRAGTSASPPADDLVATIVGFGRTLRATGVAAGPQRMHAMVEAIAHLDITRQDDVYWAGRVTLCSTPDELARYDRAFTAYFAGTVAPPRHRAESVEVARPVAATVTDGPKSVRGERSLPAATASPVEVLRNRDLAVLTPAERDDVRRMIAAIDPRGEVRTSRRYRPASGGTLDATRTVRATLRKGGKPVDLRRRAQKVRPRRLVLVVDVSGSMQPYADPLLRFAHAATRRRPGTEVFTVGTRLTRVSRELGNLDAGAALAAVSRAVPDWSGGTRLGDLLKAFLNRWGQRGTARGAVDVIATEGWERGDVTLLGAQMTRLRRLAHRVIWANPHRGQPGYVPMAAGMLAALPYVDDFVDGHTLAALERLAHVISGDKNDA